MGYKSLRDCVNDLEKHGHLLRIKEEVDPFLEAAAIHLKVYEKQGPALYFENIKGSNFPAVSNLFGTIERSKFMFRDTLDNIKTLVELKNDPIKAVKNPLKYAKVSLTALSALPMKVSKNFAPVNFATSITGKSKLIAHRPSWLPSVLGAFFVVVLISSE